MHTYTHIHINVYTYIHIYIYTYTHIYIRIYTYTHIYIFTYILYSLLYLNSRRHLWTKNLYSVISVILHSLPGNTKNRESTRVPGLGQMTW